MKLMTKHHLIPAFAVLAFVLGMSCSPRAYAASEIDCTIEYSLDGWSLIYKEASGTGTVRCDNGQSLPVSIQARALGLTAGKWRIDNGKGRFTHVRSIDETLGTYAQAEAHAGVVKSGSAQVLTKGTVSLALAGTGEGIDLGVDVGRFVLKRRR